jgi:hypothetical protein
MGLDIRKRKSKKKEPADKKEKKVFLAPPSKSVYMSIVNCGSSPMLNIKVDDVIRPKRYEFVDADYIGDIPHAAVGDIIPLRVKTFSNHFFVGSVSIISSEPAVVRVYYLNRNMERIKTRLPGKKKRKRKPKKKDT